MMMPNSDGEQPPAGERLVRRRDFLLGGIKASLSLAATGALWTGGAYAQPASSQAGGAARGRRPPLSEISLTAPPAIDDSLEVLAAYMVQYAPPDRLFPAGGGWTATYDLVEWVGSASYDKEYYRRNAVMGHLAVTRRPGETGEGIRYDMDYAIRMYGFDSLIKATMQCTAEPLPRLTNWKADYEKRRVGGSAAQAAASHEALSEEGVHKDGVLEIASAAGKRRFATGRPVAPQWAVMDALRSAGAAGEGLGEEFDLLHDLTSYRPRQRLAPCGTLEMSLDGKPYRFHGFLQTGAGTQPTHYWLDGDGRPLLATAGLLAIALTKIEA
ncbi:MAG: hypothetical protein M1457_11445 [bacterium]|nr:hypothetical protein [bacterium]